MFEFMESWFCWRSEQIARVNAGTPGNVVGVQMRGAIVGHIMKEIALRFQRLPTFFLLCTCHRHVDWHWQLRGKTRRKERQTCGYPIHQRASVRKFKTNTPGPQRASRRGTECAQQGHAWLSNAVHLAEHPRVARVINDHHESDGSGGANYRGDTLDCDEKPPREGGVVQGDEMRHGNRRQHHAP